LASRDCCLGATAKKLNEKASLHEGHGFSRAVNRLCLTASAAEVRFCETHRFAVSLEVCRHPLKALMDPRARVARLNPCPSFIRATLNSLPFRNQPINRSNLILPGQALFKAINKLHRQKRPIR